MHYIIQTDIRECKSTASVAKQMKSEETTIQYKVVMSVLLTTTSLQITDTDKKSKHHMQDFIACLNYVVMLHLDTAWTCESCQVISYQMG